MCCFIFNNKYFQFYVFILLVATATLNGLPSSRTVLNCFHLLWLYLLYPYLAGSAAYLVGSSIAFTFTLTCITFNLYYYYITVLPLPTLYPLNLMYIYTVTVARGNIHTILHKFRSTDVEHFWDKMCKSGVFFYFRQVYKDWCECS